MLGWAGLAGCGWLWLCMSWDGERLVIHISCALSASRAIALVCYVLVVVMWCIAGCRG